MYKGMMAIEVYLELVTVRSRHQWVEKIVLT